MQKPVVADGGGTISLAHRHDVDGLRAFAVLAILAFHLGLADFGGGFVGVDIFFVISGYVILRSILPDIEACRFSFRDFIVRRIRRILPALMVVLAATLAAGFLFLSPTELELLARSALATTGSVANFYFRGQGNYFASAAHTRPLLHMWSLGVEEQFYIIVPLLLAALARWRGIAAAKALLAIALASLAYNLVAGAIDERHAFYMPMARFWQIAAGGLIAVVERRWGLLRRGADVAAVLGVAAMIACVLLLEGETGGQLGGVVSVLGATLVIAAGPGSWTAAVLASRPMVAIGRRSFSIYLVHWPLIVFWKLWVLRSLQPHEQALIAILSIALAAVLYAVVEMPMRAGGHRMGNRSALIGIGAATAAVAVAATALILDRGAAWRLTPPAYEAFASLRTAVASRPRCREERMARSFSICRWNPDIPGTDFAILGDSHAMALTPELATLLGDRGKRGGISLVRPGCRVAGIEAVGLKERDKSCFEYMSAAIEVIVRERPRIVVFHGRWALFASEVLAPFDHTPSATALLDPENNRARIGLAEAMIRTVERVRASGARVIVVGPVPEIDYHVAHALVRSLHRASTMPPVWRADFDMRQKQVMQALTKVGAMDGVVVVYPHRVLCDETTCAVVEGRRALYVDDDHLSPFGAMRVSAEVVSAIDGMTGLHP